jgi:hypothetical protein
MIVPAFPNTVAIKDAIRESIQRAILINVAVEGTPCPVCDLDPITQTSTDSFCYVCSGVYWLNTVSGYVCSGHIRWRMADQPMYTAGGIIDVGDCIVTIKHTESNLTAVENSDSFTIDGRDLYLKNYVLKGVQELDRIRIILKEDSD